MLSSSSKDNAYGPSVAKAAWPFLIISMFGLQTAHVLESTNCPQLDFGMII